jgi:hypothetical protein
MNVWRLRLPSRFKYIICMGFSEFWVPNCSNPHTWWVHDDHAGIGLRLTWVDCEHLRTILQSPKKTLRGLTRAHWKESHHRTLFVTQLKASFDSCRTCPLKKKHVISCWKWQFRCLTFSNWHEGFGPQKQHTSTLKVISSLSIEDKVHENNLHISNILKTWIKLTYIKYIQIHHSNLTAV